MKGSLGNYAEIQPDFSRGVNVVENDAWFKSRIDLTALLVKFVKSRIAPGRAFPLFEKISGRFQNPGRRKTDPG
jgi:hypothetical protein